MRVRSRLFRPPAVTVVLVSLAACCLPARAAPPRWLKLESSDFVVYSNAPEKQVVECALRYAAFRRAFSELFLEPGTSVPPSVLLLFRDSDEFKEHIPPSSRTNFSTVNYSAEIDGTSFNAFALEGDRDRALEMTFEFETVWALRRAGYHAPIWMTQGAGAVLSTLTVKKGKCLVGDPGNHTIDREYPWPRFFELSESSTAYNDARTLGHYLSQAWSLMHWIVLKEGSGSARIADLAIRLRTSLAIEAVEAVMQTPRKDFDRAISQHHSHMRQPREIPFDEPAERARLHPVPAAEAEVLVQRSNLLTVAHLSSQGDVLLDRALALAPDLPVVKEADARRMFREGRLTDAIRLYREALAAGSRNSAAYCRSAEARLNDCRTNGRDVAGEGGVPAGLAVEELRQAIKLNPGSADAYCLLGRALFVLPAVTDVHLEELSRGIAAGEESRLVRFYRAQLNERLGHIDAAHADLRAIAHDPLVSEPNRRTALRRLTLDIVQRDAKQVETLARAGHCDEARAVVTAAAAVKDDDATAESYQQLGGWLDEFEAWTRVRELERSQRWPELRKAAESFAEKFSSSRRAGDARKLAASAREHENSDGAASPPP